MPEKVSLTIDGRSIEAPAGTTILEAAQSANIYIPHLCHNAELKPYGACRLCVVEIKHGKRIRQVASCIYEVAEGLEVDTNAESVERVRQMVIELLLVRNAKHPTIRKIAERHGVDQSRFDKDIRGCILCGMCIRTCQEVVGVNAIGYKNRGVDKMIATPFDEAPPDCIACGSCAYVCPVDFIQYTEKNGVRTIWNTDFEMQKCESCGRDFAPVKQLEHLQKSFDLPEDTFKICVHCR
ncbi:MAG: 2Fe-2S iron-sulfur cluster-binding protein [Proteobacteria bacterium]|nr:2Fe-2S iron-sulfur cluster-binding protein [Pseudomonadota bacterium]